MLAKTELDEVGETILKMRDYLDEHGWCQGRFTMPDGRVCIIGALMSLDMFKNPYPDRNLKYLYRSILNKLEKRIVAIQGWNDKPGRTKEEVIDMLTEVAYL